MSESTYLGKFRIIECFKKDKSFGVYLADHIYLGKNIILKTLDSSSLEDKALLERFNREAKILAKLDHPNIIKVLDFGIFKSTFYISFEYFNSKTLRDFIQSQNLSSEEKEKILIQLFQALAYAHKNGIIHRDIKPENILVDESHHLKVADFGLAHGANENHVTNQYSIVGTPSYMSPEQIRGEKLTEQSDLFSAGITSFELFTGVNPFLGKDVGQTINNLLSKEEVKLNTELPNVDDRIKSVLASLLKKNANYRTKSAVEVLSALGKALLDEKVSGKKEQKSKLKAKLIWIPLSTAAAIIVLFLFPRESGKKIIPPIENNKTSLLNRDSTDLNQAVQRVQNELRNPVMIPDLKTLTSREESKKDFTSEPEPKINFENLGWGKLMIECSPWAEVFIDNQKKDTTPLKDDISLPAGVHLISLKHPDYPIYSFNVEIKTNENSFTKINLSTLFGYLECEVFPWGDIYLDGEFKGTTPMRNAIALIPGEYKIDVKNPSFSLFTAKIYIYKGEKVIFKHNFENLADKKN